MSNVFTNRSPGSGFFNFSIKILYKNKSIYRRVYMKNKLPNENQKTFFDFTQKPWISEGQKIKVGESPLEIISGKFKILDIKEVLYGDTLQTWKIIIDKKDKIYLLKSSRELK